MFKKKEIFEQKMIDIKLNDVRVNEEDQFDLIKKATIKIENYRKKTARNRKNSNLNDILIKMRFIFIILFALIVLFLHINIMILTIEFIQKLNLFYIYISFIQLFRRFS